ncbi:MAG: F0F1 ATP synthase subunit A [Planctomycetes bacterium]|nr:F0F1 ATP synthase subunit A [Planctomycetota bacterium]
MGMGHADTFHHVRDFPYFELPFGLRIDLPFGLTKFMVLQLVAFLLALWIFRGLAKRAQSGEPVRGRWWNFWEVLALFIRDEVVRPTIGGHDDHHGGEGQEAHEGSAVSSAAAHPADKYLPFVWSTFFYILFCNLLGAIPLLGSPTGEINVTGALALVAFVASVIYGVEAQGVRGYLGSFLPHMEVPGALSYVLAPMIWTIEFVGICIKHGVLCVRLFANIMAGHTVIGMILAFIAMTANSWLYYVVLPTSIFGQVAIGCLELFVAFLQAYIFAFLSTLFIGMAIHPH